MTRSKRNVSILTFRDSVPELGRFVKHLVELGFNAEETFFDTVNPDLDLVQKPQHILFLKADEAPFEFRNLLHEHPFMPRLAVVAESQEWDRSILNYCTEVITWPCTTAELGFRLNRVMRFEPAPTPSMLPDVFVQLNMLGQAPCFIRALTMINRMAESEVPILICGETGTGKELAARAIHYLGRRRDCPFISANCGAIPEDLFENELFGHSAGAYTDAKQKQKGLVEKADGGTLFLDEIDALSLKSQTSLLRLLQDGSFKPLGSEDASFSDVRIIAAANVNLHDEVANNRFRRDLLFRLDVLSVELPPLRERSGDALRMATHFVSRYSREYNLKAKPLHPAFVNWLENYHWPGNVRELENSVLRACLLSDGDYITSDVITPAHSDETGEFGSFTEEKTRMINTFEKDYLQRLMMETNGNVTLAAKRARKERRALGKLLRKHGIERREFVARI